ncbi:cation:proton antiporter [Gottschalkiaceae bacterium SANA]|nr:cation:proton antiporter [Gottschalkiaceae bacterium SANA]
MLKGIILLITFMLLAVLAGKLIAKIHMPAILGWLLTGMLIGPYALGWFSLEIMESSWFHAIISICELTAGIFIGTELVWKEMKTSGKQIFIICLAEGFNTFFVVSVAFGILFYLQAIPLYLAFLMGSIALATAPAPSLSIISEYKTKGPVTKTLMPLAILDDVIAILVFFTVLGIVSNRLSGSGLPLYYAPLVLCLSILLGIAYGIFASYFLKPQSSKTKTVITLGVCVGIATAFSLLINEHVLPSPMMNLMLIGVSFAATFTNLLPQERMTKIKSEINLFVVIAMILLILDLGAPLDFHLIIGAGWFTAVYILARAFGKISGSYLGSVLSKAPNTVKKYLGLTLLPHSGVSLIFTGISVGVLSQNAPEYASIIQGTIAAAAVINEIFAVILAKQGFKLAGEIASQKSENTLQSA